MERKSGMKMTSCLFLFALGMVPAMADGTDGALDAVGAGGGVAFFLIGIAALVVGVFIVLSPIFIFVRLGRIATAVEKSNVFLANLDQNVVAAINRPAP
jgi:hypothetical protein